MFTDSLVKSVATVLIGAGGVGVASPIAYVVSSQPFHKTLWRKSLDKTKARISCKTVSGGKYVLGIDLAEEEREDFGSEITLKAWKSNGINIPPRNRRITKTELV